MKEKFLSLEWFKSKIETVTATVIERRLEKMLDNLVEDDSKNEPQEDCYEPGPSIKPYKQVKLIGDTLSVILYDGEILMKSDATADDFRNIQNSISLSEIYDLMTSPEILIQRQVDAKEKSRMAALAQGFDLLLESGDFEEHNGSFFLKGISRTLPQMLIEKFIAVIAEINNARPDEISLKKAVSEDEEFLSLKRFFMWCCLNPRAEVADDLYNFLAKNSFRITKQGFFVALRNVVTVANDDDTALVKFISNAYNKIKAVWKKNPANYLVVKTITGDYELEKIGSQTTTHTKLGILSELYVDLPNMRENRFTDAHTRTFDIRIGKVVNMPSEECNWSRADCAHAGLHFTADEINYVGCGDTSVIILINPMKVVGIGDKKGRCYEYLPIMAVPAAEVTQILHDGAFDTLQLDEDYVIKELESLQIKAQEGFTIETTKYQFNLPSISLKEITGIVNSLNSMKDTIDKRVQTVD
jgi:hypothetical protein